MGEFSIGRRTLLRGVAGVGAASVLPTGTAAAEMAAETDPTTRATFSAIVDAVIPETPAVAEELGEQHRPGGLEVGLDAYLIEYVNTLFSMGNSVLGELDDLRLAEIVAATCDVAAVELLVRGGNEAPPDPTRFEAGRPFAWLERDDRLRALALLDEKEVDTAQLPGPVLEASAGLIPQLVVAFTQVIYYSEWEGYADVRAPPGERGFEDDGLQSWEQADFPGVVDGAAVLRGYLSAPGSSLGDGGVWKHLLDPAEGGAGGGGSGPRIRYEPGEFEENDYDTSGYEEPYDTSGEPASGFDVAEMDVRRLEDAVEDREAGLDDAVVAALRARIEGGGLDGVVDREGLDVDGADGEAPDVGSLFGGDLEIGDLVDGGLRGDR